jgi:hypothetical protein
MYDMNRKSLLFTLPVIALLMMSCQLSTALNRQTIRGSGNLKTEQRQVSDIERVSLEGLGDITLIQGNEEALTVEADDNVMPYIETVMRGHELVLRTKDGYNFSGNITVRYTLKVKNVNAIAISGSGSVTSEKLNVGDLALTISGSGDMKIADLQAQNLRTTTTGSGNYDLKGKVKSQNLTISGMGNFVGGDLQSSESNVTISGSGNVMLWADEKLDIRIMGSGSVNYYGKPAISQSITGSGGIKGLGTHQ